MPADLLPDAARMAAAALAVAAVAAPAGLGCWAVARRLREPLRPHPAPWRKPWTGADVGFLLVGLVAVTILVGAVLYPSPFFRLVYGPDFPPPPPADPPPADAVAAVAGTAATSAQAARSAEAGTVRGLWAALIALPIQLLAVWAARNLFHPEWRPPPRRLRAVPARVALGVLAWTALTPAVFAVHFATTAAFQFLNWGVEDHPLTQLGPWRPAIDRALFVFQACVAAPLVEELSFRGVLLPWLLGGSRRELGLRQRGRVWAVLIAGMALAAAVTSGELAQGRVRGPVVFATALAAAWVPLSRLVTKRRTWGAVWASAALFAAVHSAVWPSPVPLFAFGLGLGWLAVATRGVLVPAVVHGLFNAVSAVYVLGG